MNKRYPLHQKISYHFWIAIGLAIWVFVFLYLSEPFDIHKFSNTEKWTLLPLYGLIEGICYAIPLVYQSSVFKKNQNWHVSNELLFLIIVIILGALINFIFYKTAVVYNEEGTYSFWEYSRWVYLPGLAIILPFVIVSRFILGKFSERIQLDDQITIQGKGQSEFIHLKAADLVCISSADNYIEISFLEMGMLQKKVIRATLSEVHKKYPSFIKPHRSYLVNPLHFKQFKSVNKKLVLDLGNQVEVPVSRNLQSEMKRKFQLTTNT